MLSLTNDQKRLLASVQEEFPLTTRPFHDLAVKVGLAESEVLKIIQLLKEQEVIRQISAIFDTRCLGYQSSLVAMRVDSKREDEAAETINGHPGVSHNYRRNHAFNIWFTVAVPPNSRLGLQKTVDLFHALSGAESTRPMPTLKLFKIGVNLDVTGDRPTDQRSAPQYTEEMRHRPKNEITSAEVELIRILQEDMPVVSKPYQVLADQIGISEAELFAMAGRLMKEGKLRRFAAVLNHRKAGFVANAMGVWDVSSEEILKIGNQMGSFSAVSHCYQRPVYPDWPYSIFTMVHGRNKEECDKILETISQTTGITRYEALFSTKEYKKIRLKYFTSEIGAWEDRYAPD
jgi:DNA-binding Lrp family transcriptional regulator